MTRWTKADRVFLGAIALPILSVIAMFLLASVCWLVNDRQVNARMLDLVRSERDAGTAESLAHFFLRENEIEDDENQRLLLERRWRQLSSAVALIQQWHENQFRGELQDNFLELVKPEESDQLVGQLSQLNDRIRPVLRELDDLLVNSGVSLAAAYKDQLGYERTKYGDFDVAPFYRFYELANVSLYHAILTEDSKAGIQAIERLNRLLTPGGDQVVSPHVMFYYQAMLTQVRRTIAQGFWNASELEQLDALLKVHPHFASAVHRYNHVKLLSLAYAMKSPQRLQNMDWLMNQLGSRFRRTKDRGLTTIAPSERLTLLDGFSSGDASRDGAQATSSKNRLGNGFDFDQWLKRPYMNLVFRPEPGFAYQEQFERSLPLIANDRLFTQVAIAIAKRRQATGEFPSGLSDLSDSLTTQQIASSKELLDYRIVDDPKTVAQLTAKYYPNAEQREGDGEAENDDFSVRVTIP